MSRLAMPGGFPDEPTAVWWCIWAVPAVRQSAVDIHSWTSLRSLTLRLDTVFSHTVGGWTSWMFSTLPRS